MRPGFGKKNVKVGKKETEVNGDKEAMQKQSSTP